MPVTQWNYLTEPGVRRIGPVAQDFYAAFGLGTDDKSISTVDASGVALAAIQGLHQTIRRQMPQKDREIAQLKRKLQAIKTKLGL